jgi:hypothetical protein
MVFWLRSEEVLPLATRDVNILFGLGTPLVLLGLMDLSARATGRTERRGKVGRVSDIRWLVRWARPPLVAGAALFLLSACGEPSFDDPDTASCDAPQVIFSEALVLGDHQQMDVHFTCEGAIQAGTLYLPVGAGPYPAVVWVHGAGEVPRLSYGD